MLQRSWDQLTPQSVAYNLLGQNMYKPVNTVNQSPAMVIALFPNGCPYELLCFIRK